MSRLGDPRFNKLYLDDVVECQGDLFVEAHECGYDLVEFTKYYMNSEIRYKIDIGMPRFATLSGREILDDLYDKFNLDKEVKKSRKYNDGFMWEWLGQFYALFQWYAGIRSKNVLQYVPIEDMIYRYSALHDMDITLVVQKIVKDRKIKPIKNRKE